jgi:hypothetical protein
VSNCRERQRSCDHLPVPVMRDRDTLTFRQTILHSCSARLNQIPSPQVDDLGTRLAAALQLVKALQKKKQFCIL